MKSLEARYLDRLAELYPSIAAASTEVINLEAILNLPKGTEHFMTDIHGEYEAFRHFVRSGSGMIRMRIDEIFGDLLTESERDDLASLIYNPEAEMARREKSEADFDAWSKVAIRRLLMVCRLVSNKYTRSKVKKRLPKDSAYIMDELLFADNNPDRHKYYDEIIDSIIEYESGRLFILQLTEVISNLTVDRLHIIGDIFDRGAGSPEIMDYLMENVKYPKTAFDADIQGRVIAQFVVDKEGTVRDAHVVKSVDPALDAEALRVINNMPKWRPGRQNGKVVNVKYTIPVSFSLDGNNDSPQTAGSPNLEGYSLTVDGEKVDIGMLKEISPYKIRSVSVDKSKQTVSVTTYKNSATQFIIQFLHSAREKCKNETGRDLNSQKITVNGKVMTLDEIEASSLNIRDIGPVVVDKSYNIIVNTK